jgi:hypothetical protein
LVDRGYGTGGIDFLEITRPLADAVITNPPFGKHVDLFIRHALEIGTPYVAMLVNTNLWHAARRTKLWNLRRPEAVYALCWRPDFTGSDSPYFNCIWTVWGPESAKVTRYERLERPSVVPVSHFATTLARYERAAAMAARLSHKIVDSVQLRA